MGNLKISKLEFEALVRGFTVSEREGWHNVQPEEYSRFPAVLAHPEAFSDGVKLKNRVNMVISCDSATDWNRDIASYDETVRYLNEKYGRVAILSDEIEKSKSHAYGIIGYRFSPWKQVTVTTYHNDKPNDLAVVFPQETVLLEDERVREEMGLSLDLD